MNKYWLFETGSGKWIMLKDDKALFTSNKEHASQFSVLELVDAINHKEIKWLADRTLKIVPVTQ